MFTPLAVPIFILFLSLTVPSFPILPIFILFLSRMVWADEGIAEKAVIGNRTVKNDVLMFGVSLSDEVHEYMFLVSLRGCIAVGMDFLQQPSHIRC